MAHDYEDIHNIDSLDDRELRDLVREQLAQHGALDVDDITVRAADGIVTLSGRVGTEGERRVAEHVLTDVLGISKYTNDLVIDPLHRGVSPMPIDEHMADEAARDGTLLTDVPVPMTAESEHLADSLDDDVFGTTDYQRVMEDGMTWNPPDSPTPEGMSGTDAGPAESGGQH
jgi:hypothetical protein